MKSVLLQLQAHTEGHRWRQLRRSPTVGNNWGRFRQSAGSKLDGFLSMNNKNGAWEKSELSKLGQGCRALQIKEQHASVQAARIAPLTLLGKQREKNV